MFGDDPIEQIRLAIEDLEAEDRRKWTGAARSAQLLELLEVARRLQAQIVRSVRKRGLDIRRHDDGTYEIIEPPAGRTRTGTRRPGRARPARARPGRAPPGAN